MITWYRLRFISKAWDIERNDITMKKRLSFRYYALIIKAFVRFPNEEGNKDDNKVFRAANCNFIKRTGDTFDQKYWASRKR